jgi:hypothetical protein
VAFEVSTKTVYGLALLRTPAAPSLLGEVHKDGSDLAFLDRFHAWQDPGGGLVLLRGYLVARFPDVLLGVLDIQNPSRSFNEAT